MAKSGFVALAGRPNVGKSTLLNHMVGHKIAITSPRPQTTRNKILGVLHRPDLQIVFMDTPGVTTHKSALTRSMFTVSAQASADADLLVFLADAQRMDVDEDRLAFRRIGMKTPRSFLVLNKIDLIDKGELLKQIEEYSGMEAFEEIVPVSARTGENVETLVELIARALPEGPLYYPNETITDQPEKFTIAEIIREKAIPLLQKELPYSLAVVVENIEERSSGLSVIFAAVFVERESQRGIVIGKGGAMIKKIGEAARIDLERRLNTRIFLDLSVKVKEKWTGDTKSIRDFGYGPV